MPPKKQKEKALSLEDFAKLAQESGSGRSWADDEAEFTTPSFQTMSQPSAPSASLGAWTSGSAGGAMSGTRTFAAAPVAPIPDQPPFTARIGNVSYDVDETHLHDFFGNEHNLNIETLRLPRGPDGQIKGAAYIDFADRDSLVAALKLGGSQILGRTVSVNVAEQRGPSSAFGPRGGPEFDWSKKVDTDEFFGAGPPGGDDRFSRFRPRAPRPDEPELDWTARGAPLGPARTPRAPEPELDWTARTGPISSRPPRTPREPEPELDWTARTGPISSRPPRTPRAPEPELDWSARTGPIAPRSSRPPRAAAPELDWSARTGPISQRSQRKPRAAEPELDWSQRGTSLPNRSGSQGLRKQQTASPQSSTASSASSIGGSTAGSTSETKKTSEASKIAKLQQGFKALQLDDEDAEETPAEKAAEPVTANSISDIQKAQREASTGKWSEA